MRPGEYAAEASSRLRDKPDLVEALKTFDQFWGLDAYEPPDHVREAVRQIVRAVVLDSGAK